MNSSTHVHAEDAVAAVLDRMPPEQDIVDTADVFSLLGDPRRLKLLVALLDGELCVCDLAAIAGLSESATSHALRLLRAHRVVSARREGRMAFYRLDDAHVRMLLDLAVAHTGHTAAIHPERNAAATDHAERAAGTGRGGHGGGTDPGGREAGTAS